MLTKTIAGVIEETTMEVRFVPLVRPEHGTPVRSVSNLRAPKNVKFDGRHEGLKYQH